MRAVEKKATEAFCRMASETTLSNCVFKTPLSEIKSTRLLHFAEGLRPFIIDRLLMLEGIAFMVDGRLSSQSLSNGDRHMAIDRLGRMGFNLQSEAGLLGDKITFTVSHSAGGSSKKTTIIAEEKVANTFMEDVGSPYELGREIGQRLFKQAKEKIEIIPSDRDMTDHLMLKDQFHAKHAPYPFMADILSAEREEVARSTYLAACSYRDNDVESFRDAKGSNTKLLPRAVPHIFSEVPMFASSHTFVRSMEQVYINRLRKFEVAPKTDAQKAEVLEGMMKHNPVYDNFPTHLALILIRSLDKPRTVRSMPKISGPAKHINGTTQTLQFLKSRGLMYWDKTGSSRTTGHRTSDLGVAVLNRWAREYPRFRPIKEALVTKKMTTAAMARMGEIALGINVRKDDVGF